MDSILPETGSSRAASFSATSRNSILRIVASRGLKFQAVGWLGMLVNTGALYLLKGILGVPLIPASLIAIEIAILHNFIWHRHWTWKQRVEEDKPPFFQQLLLYNTATGLVDLAVNVSLLWLFTTLFGVYYLISNIIGMIMGPVFKFWLNEKLIFRRKSSSRGAQRTLSSMNSNRETENRLRTNACLLSGVEGRVLPWMARRLPAWITPDRLTLLGLISGAVIAAGYFLTVQNLAWLWLANAGFVLHWWADSLDGTLARVRKIERPKYGFFVDHYSDALTVTVITVAMGLSPLMDLTVALLLLIGYHSLAILVYLVTIARGEFKISFAKIGPTEVRLIIMAANTLLLVLGNPTFLLFGFQFTLFTICGILVAAGFMGFFIVSGWVERGRMLSIDRPPALHIPQRTNGHSHAKPDVKVREDEKVPLEV